MAYGDFQSPYGESLPQSTYTQNGYTYYNEVPMPNYGSNPWSAMAENQQGFVNSAQNATAGLGDRQMALQGQIGQFQQMQAQGAYPTFPNAYGIGSQQPVQSEEKQTATPLISDRGFNPYSLTGEANTR